MMSHKKSVSKVLTVFVCFLMTATAFVSIPVFTDKVKAEGTPNGSGGSVGSSGVDPASGSYSESISLLNIPGRGVDVDLSLRYNSRIWLADPEGPNGGMIGVPSPLVYNGNKQWLEDYSTVGLGFDLSMGRLYGTRYRYQEVENGPYYYWYRFCFEDPNGGRILFVSDNPQLDTYPNDPSYDGRDDRFIALDTSGATLLISWAGQGQNNENPADNLHPTEMTVVLPNGISYIFGTSLLSRTGGGFGFTNNLILDEGGNGGSGSPGLCLHPMFFNEISNDAIHISEDDLLNGKDPLGLFS
jgi:hypothetical protein